MINTAGPPERRFSKLLYSFYILIYSILMLQQTHNTLGIPGFRNRRSNGMAVYTPGGEVERSRALWSRHEKLWRSSWDGRGVRVGTSGGSPAPKKSELSLKSALDLSTSRPLDLSTSRPLDLSTSRPLDLSTSRPPVALTNL